MSESRINEVYVALRNLLGAKFVSRATKEQVARAVHEMSKEAFVENITPPKDIKDAA